MSSSIPRFPESQIEQIVADHYGLSARATPLASYRDQNLLLKEASGRKWVFKVANRDEPLEQITAQHLVLEHLSRQRDVLVPQVRNALDGRQIIEIEDSSQRVFNARMVSFLPGQFLGDHDQPSDDLYRSIGTMLGRLNHHLRDFDGDQVPHRHLKWDLKNALEARRFSDLIVHAEDRRVVAAVFDYFEKNVRPLRDELRQSVIHNDANDFNLLLRRLGAVWEAYALIDFGDMVQSFTVADLAIAIAYAILDKPDPVRVAAIITAGFHQAFPLRDAELCVLFPLICTRLATSVSFSAEGKRQDPNNEYLLISEGPAWRTLHQLFKIDPFWVEMTLRHYCDLEPNPRALDLLHLLQNEATVPAVDVSKGVPISLGPDTEIPTDTQSAIAALNEKLAETDSDVAFGGYLENRNCYGSESFVNQDGDQRSVHLGIDVFAKPGTPIRVPLDAWVHGLADNDAPFDYGPTVVLRHECRNMTFYTLYGHLSRTSISQLKVGDRLRPGQVLAEIGQVHENGGWVPHLHLQAYAHDLGLNTDLPGTCSPKDVPIWRSLCPDPSALLGIVNTTPTRSLISRRKTRLAPSLSLSYNRPLHITRGSMQYLLDASGRAYLDAVNNVPHVGHCHPRVVAAQQQQCAWLNTNTRYLHSAILDFSDHLVATMPAGLEVCFVVNSGSEANDLALRIARHATGRDQTVVMQGGYHGNLASLVEISEYKFNGPGGTGSSQRVLSLPMPDVFRGMFTGARAAASYIDDMKRRIDETTNLGHPPGAAIAEAILGCGGQVPLPPGYLKALFDRVRELGGICIADEVQIGLGRLGSHTWGFQWADAQPDIVTIGKPIGNGQPLGVVVTTRALATSFANGMEYFNTFGGNPVSSRIGDEVLAIMRDEGLQENALRVGAYLKNRLSELAQNDRRIGDVRGVGLFLGVELMHGDQPDPQLASHVVQSMCERAVLVSRDGPQHNVIKIKPPLCFSRHHADQLTEALGLALAR